MNLPQIQLPKTKVAFPTDEHVPFHDPEARSVALQIVEEFQPDILTAGSDGIDFYAISKFDKDPARLKAGGLQDEIDQWTQCQREWRSAAPSAKRPFLIGNHEYRLERYLRQNPELYDLRALKFPTLLEFDKLGIEWDENEGGNLEIVINDLLVIRHGEIVRKHSAYSAKAELEREFYSINVMTGHTHRGGVHYATTRNGVLEAHECFCLCSLTPDYVSNPNWQQGIVLATVGDSVSFESIPFHKVNGKTIARWRGREFRSK